MDSSNTLRDLLPCPFCGQEPILLCVTECKLLAQRDEIIQQALAIPEPATTDVEGIHECGHQSGLMYARLVVAEILGDTEDNARIQAELSDRSDGFSKPVADVEREEIASIIDPTTTPAWFKKVKPGCTCGLCVQNSKTLDLADQIKALFASKSSGSALSQPGANGSPDPILTDGQHSGGGDC